VALRIDCLPEEIETLSAGLRVRLEQHRNLRMQFYDAALAVDEAALKDIRARLVDADKQVEGAYAALCDATQRFGADVSAAVRSLLEEPEPTKSQEI
jgi:hypothetical protein